MIDTKLSRSFLLSSALALCALPLVADHGAHAHAKPAPATGSGAFGAPISAADPLSVDAVVARAGELDGKSVLVAGRVSAVCQMEGCWLTLASEQNGPEVRIKMKDHAFVVPKDLAGSKVVAEGVLRNKVTSVAELKHLAEDAGKSAEEIARITEAKKEVSFEATGVRVVPEAG